MSIARHSSNPLVAYCVALAVAVFLVGCASTFPLSYLHGDLQTRVHTDLYPVWIVSVDGAFAIENPRAVAPGARWLVVEAEPAQGARTSDQKAVVVKVAPCTRYYFAAKRMSPMAREWELVLERTEAVSGCNADEELKKAGDQAGPLRAPSK